MDPVCPEHDIPVAMQPSSKYAAAGSPVDRIPNALISGVDMSYGEGTDRPCCPY
jgi:hypothetical protein